MSRRLAFLLAVFVADWLAFLPVRLGYAPIHTSLGRLLMISGSSVVVCVAAVVLARRRDLFTAADLGLTPTETQRARAIVGGRFALVLLGLFVGAALLHMLPPVNYSLWNRLSYPEFVDELRRHEWRDSFARSVPPVDAADAAIVFVHGVILSPLTEEIPYRALFMPTVLPYLGRHGAALASGVVFFGLHVLVYGLTPAADYFLAGVAYAYFFGWFGLAGAVAVHAGGNFGLLLLALYVEFWA
ncbi:CPBP family intramembrane glutamic endopeptidase [Nannocystis pusilla]|uniref:CPBP family intramembrane metalloprotease n=1 Tax=Nannocystis pusilla TaxID=889268 RepID=A0ABS7TXQ7_9BACT|nr:CPBP family intramembrane glutamic endopeptidase [Nannocystis pusilla]MBZ5713015.1 CPBP family intramembrane metalloprotease [Nannocystis pusilla]